MAVNTAWALILLGTATYLLSGDEHSTLAARRQSQLERLLLGGFIPTLLFVVMGGGFIYNTGANFAQATELVAHSQEVRAELGKVYGLVADAELSRRNHLLTSEPLFDAESLREALEASKRVDNLAVLMSDNPLQLLLQRRLDELIDLRVRALQSVGEALVSQGEPAARRLLLDDANQRLMRDIRDTLSQMDSAEVGLLEGRLRSAQRQRQTTLIGLLLTLAMLTGLFVVLFRSIQREITARALAEDRLHSLNADLEQRVAERTRQLEFQQAFLRRVVDLNRNLIFAKDREGRFVLANQPLADLYGTTADAMVGQSEHKLNSDAEQVRRFHAADLQVIDSGQDLIVPEEQVSARDGTPRWFSTVKRPILSPDGTQMILLGVATDITDRKAAEDKLRQLAHDLERRVQARTLELQSANAELVRARLASDAASRAKSAFLANMSHEIRTPMNAIIGLTHLMTRESRDHLQHDRLGKVTAAAQHLLRVINDILDISKIEAGKLTLDDTEFSLEQLLSTAMELATPQARAKGLEVILDPDGLPDSLRGDPTRLSQILINLLANAVKFTEHGWVRLRGEMLAEQGGQVLMRFEVQDTGPGIAQAQQAGLFSAFEQGDSSASRQHGGTGLGLALSRQLARAMGGDAGVDSAPGAGSRFWFTAWLARGAPTASGPLQVSLQGLRALLVDDLPEARVVIAERLQGLGLRVDAVDGCQSALGKLELEMSAGRAYDVALIDWRMEPADGLQTLAAMRAVLGDGMPASILVTAFDDATLAQRARDAGFDAVMLKPITSSALQDQLAVLLRPQRMPLQLSAAPASDAETLLRPQHAGQRVLLAEDNAVNQEVAQALLRLVGLAVDVAPDGARAVEMALSGCYDLVLMDVQMPVIDGLEATRAIRRSAGRALPIIAMTANAFVDDRQSCLDAGMNDHVAKPVDPAQLYATLSRWLALPPSAPQQARGPTLHERLEAVAGLDLATALRHVAGQMPILERALRSFVGVYRSGLPALVKTGDDDAAALTRWKTVCHSLRGALTTIGAAALLQELSAFEQQIADAAPHAVLAASAEALHADLLRLVQSLAAALQTPAPA